jgi:uncharacterized membrane protein YqiK
VTDEGEASSGQRRNKRYRQNLAERGIKPFQVIAPEETRDLFRKAATLMTRDDDPMDPRAAFRLVGGANEPEPGDASAELRAELDAARSRIEAIEREAEKRRAEIEAQGKAREHALQAERDAARAAEAASQSETQEAARAAQAERERAKEAQERAEKAEATIRQARSLPGLKGRLVRWLAGDVLPD